MVPRRRAIRPAGLIRSFLILHGLEGNSPEHWQTWLAGELTAAGEEVRYPDLPEPFDPDPEEWLACLRGELAGMDGERVVVCHSLACLLWMRHAQSASAPVDRVLLVAPPGDRQVPAIERFWPVGAGGGDLQHAARVTRTTYSDNDPWCPGGAGAHFGGLGLPTDVIEGAGHLNTDAGYGPWPAALEWALGRREDVGPR